MISKNKRDSASKRSVPSPKVESLHQNLGLGKKEGFGTPHPAQDYLFDNIKGGEKKNTKVGTPGRSKDPGGVKTRKGPRT